MTTQDKFCTSVAVKICNEGNAPPYVPFKLNVYRMLHEIKGFGYLQPYLTCSHLLKNINIFI